MHASLGVSILRARFATRAHPEAAAPTELDLDLSSAVVVEPATAEGEPLAEAARPAAPQQGGARTTRGLEARSGAGTEGEGAVPLEGPVVAGATGWSFSPTTTTAPIDVLGGGVVGRPSPEASHAREVAPSAGASGAVLAVTEEAVRTSLAPDEGNARFTVVVWKNGDVHAALTGASSADEAWSRVLGAIEGAVKRRGVRVPEGAKGVLVEMTLESTIRYVDGRRPANAGTRSVVQGLGHEGSVMDQMPMIGVHHEGRYCAGAAGITPAGLQLGGGCSPENAAPATRHVRGQITQESRID